MALCLIREVIMALFVVLWTSQKAVHALDNGLAITPPMGYNTWNAFHCDIDEDSVKENINLMIKLGLRDAGYTYFNLDDCWQLDDRSEAGELQPNATRFPSGMKALGDYIHSKGMKFGIYSDAGTKTCAGKAGSLGHEEVDAKTFASYGADYLKYDNCYSPPLDQMDVRVRYAAMRDALNKTGRPVVYSICDWGVGQPQIWGPSTGNSWRTTNDIQPCWDCVLRCLDMQIGLSMYAGPGAWNDPDMLEVGNPGANGEMYIYRQRAHFALWAIMKAPLLIGTDLRKIAPEALKILLAKEVIAINQDALGVPGDLIFTQGPLQIFGAPLMGGARAVALFYRQVKGLPVNITVSWSMLGYPEQLSASVRDLHEEKDLGTHSGSFTIGVPPDNVVLLKLTPVALRGSSSLQVKGLISLVSRGSMTTRGVHDTRSTDSPIPRALLAELDSWRPWSHGFFGPKQPCDSWKVQS